MDNGVAASSRLIVSRTARLCTSGTTTSPMRAATRNPIPKYMIGSIMELTSPTHAHSLPLGPDSPVVFDISLKRVPRRGFRHLQRELVNVANSEGIPRRLRRKFEITDIGAKAQSNAGPNRHDDDVAVAERGHAEPANEIGGAVDAGKALINRAGGRQVIDKHHRARAFAAIVEADRRPFPEHAAVAGILRIKLAVAVA